MTYPIPPEALKESVAIIGRTGSGKTFAAKGAVELLLREGARVCIIDPTSVWWGLRSVQKRSRAPSATTMGSPTRARWPRPGSALAKWALALRIGGFEDWHIPSRLESLILFGELKGTKAFDFEQDWYWTSTQSASGSDYAWCQDFLDGNQSYYRKDFELRARAVRQIPI